MQEVGESRVAWSDLSHPPLSFALEKKVKREGLGMRAAISFVFHSVLDTTPNPKP